MVSAAAQRDSGLRAEGTHLLSSGGRPQQTAGFRENEAAGWEKVHEVYRVHPDKQASQPSQPSKGIAELSTGPGSRVLAFFVPARAAGQEQQQQADLCRQRSE